MTVRPTPAPAPSSHAEQYRRVRAATVRLCEPLGAEDCVVQTMNDVSPTKWHLAHTTWFFETFLLQPHVPDYTEFHPQFGYLFNSYYNAIGPRHERGARGVLTRPTLDEVRDYRAHVDERMASLLEGGGGADPAAVEALLQLGVHHEQQHQELILTDIKHVFWCNPLRPAYVHPDVRPLRKLPPLGWVRHDAGLHQIGHDGRGFAFDNEGPRHRAFVESFELADRLVTNGEYLAFMDDGGYQRPELWLSDGWDAVRAQDWQAPLYWDRQGGQARRGHERQTGRWWVMTLSGMRELAYDEPVCHVSFYEADAYARWAGARLPRETEWEVAAAAAPMEGNFVESQRFHPMPLGPGTQDGPRQMFGDVWEWTMSPYTAYPGYRPAQGALGEYNGKFMSGQMVLRGGSCATPADHVRRTYRNFFPVTARWQFSGIRLARD